MDIEKSIMATKQGFEASFQEKQFYNRQTQDEEHLSEILQILPIKDGMRILDLGTGSGYLSFYLARKNPKIQVVGLDIVEQTLEQNRDRANEDGLTNLEFICYDGIDFPMEKESFDLVVTRYALHHFPMIEHTFFEISRIMKRKGHLFLSDPTPNEEDEERFVDTYMQMKKDGHIKFYTSNEFIDLGRHAGLKLQQSFLTSIRFPKKKKDAKEFEQIMKQYSEKITKGYHLEITDQEIFITEKVLNMLFQKDN